MSHHCCVWIDHREARIFHIEADRAEEETIREAGPAHHIHRSSDHLGLGKEGPDPEFLGEVAGALAGETAILIAGPGEARQQFSRFLADKHPQIASRVWDVVAMDHPTDRQIVAAARLAFRAGDRMRGQGR